MGFEKNNKYFTLCVYIVLTSIMIVIATLSIFHFKEVLTFAMQIISHLYRLFKPLIIGAVIAYLLDPIVEFYEKRCRQTKWHPFKIKFLSLGKNKRYKKEECSKSHLRTMSTLLTAFTLIALIGLFVMIVVMNFQNVLGSGAVQNISSSVNRYISYFENMLVQVTQFIDNIPFFTNSTHIVEEVYHYIDLFTVRLSEGVLNFFTVLGTNTLDIALAFVIAFYLLQDKKRILLLMNKIFQSILPERIYRNAKILVEDIDYVFSNYIRGQMIDAVIIAILTSLALTLIKMDFAIIIGVIAGLFNLIPYVGPVIGFILAGVIGLTGPDPMKAVYGVIALFIIQQIDGWIIVPKVIGSSVKLHPVVVLLSILIGGKLFGLMGMLLGVPIAAFVRLAILRYAKDVFEIEKEQ